MAALSTDRDTIEMAQFGDAVASRAIPQEGATTLHAGALVMTSASGHAAPGAAATGRVALGRCQKRSVNAGADGAATAEVKPGVYKWNNSAAGEAVTQAEVGKVCYIVDDNTVGKTDAVGTLSPAGKVVQVDSDGVWVATGLGAIAGDS